MTQFETLLALSLAGYAKGQWGMAKADPRDPEVITTHKNVTHPTPK